MFGCDSGGHVEAMLGRGLAARRVAVTSQLGSLWSFRLSHWPWRVGTVRVLVP